MGLLIADVRSLAAGQYESVIVFGDLTVGDGGGGLYLWNAAATNADDSAAWIKPNSVDVGSPGRWQRIWGPAPLATTTSAGLVELATSGEASASVAVVGTDARLSDARTPTAHDHAANKLAQENTHESPDTDIGATSLHHTLGAGANQAAAGTHNHDAAYVSVVATPTTGNFPVLTAGGELDNSTYSNASFATAAQGTLAGTALQPADVGTMATQASGSVSITGGSITGIADLDIADGGTGASTAEAAFTALKQAATETTTGVVELGTSAETTSGLVVQCSDTRLHPPASFSGTPNYITIDPGTQVITRNAVDLATDVTGVLPLSALANLSTVTESGTSHTNTAGDRNAFVRWTNTGAKTYTIDDSVMTAGDTLQGINAAGSGDLTIAQGAGVTLTGNLVFAPLKSYTIRFTASSAADVIGGSAT